MGPVISLAFAVAATANSQSPALSVLDGLNGCWNAPGEVLGSKGTYLARGEWHLGHRYFMLHLRSTAPAKAYEAALLYGGGGKPEEINAYWMDSFGGAFSTAGSGAVASDGFAVVYTYPDSVYTNRFRRAGKGWTWTIIENVPGKPERTFARYDLKRTSCRDKTFTF